MPQRTLAATLLLVAVLAMAQQARAATAADPCGDPATVSNAYEAHFGRVQEVLDAVTLVVEVAPEPPGSQRFPGCAVGSCRARIRLVALDPPLNPQAAAAARQALAAAVLGEDVALWLSHHQDEEGPTNALVFAGDQNLNEAQLAAGQATYRSFASDAVDWYQECRLREAEKAARLARRGAWAPR